MALAAGAVVSLDRRAGPLERARPILVGAAISATAVVAAWRFLYLAVRTLGFPYPLDYGEGAVLDGALRLAQFLSLYPADLQSPPWFVSNYPPVSYLVHVPFIWAAGPALWYGRLVSQASAVCAAALIGSVVTTLTRQTSAGVLAAVTFLAIPIVGVWSQYDRVDMLAHALSWASVWLIVTRDRAPRVGLAALCCVLSSFTRQTAAIPALVAAYVWLRHQGNARIANRLAMLVAGGGVAGLLSLTLYTHGGFLSHTVTGTVGRMDVGQLLHLNRQLLDLIPYLIALAAGVVLVGMFAQPAGWPFAATYISVAAIMSLAVAKEGSYINYFLDLCAAGSLAAGLCVAWLRTRPLLAVALLLMLSVQAVRMGRSNSLYDHLLARLGRASEYAHLASLVQTEQGPVLADEPLALLPLSGRTIDFQPFAMTQLARAGRWNPAPFIQQLRRQRFALLLLRMPRRTSDLLAIMWDTEVAEAIRACYERVEEVPVDDGAVIAVMRPRPATDGEVGARARAAGVSSVCVGF